MLDAGCWEKNRLSAHGSRQTVMAARYWILEKEQAFGGWLTAIGKGMLPDE
jgi:hypothetical protein